MSRATSGSATSEGLLQRVVCLSIVKTFFWSSCGHGDWSINQTRRVDQVLKAIKQVYLAMEIIIEQCAAPRVDA
jgi:hypothetical protein